MYELIDGWIGLSAFLRASEVIFTLFINGNTFEASESKIKSIHIARNRSMTVSFYRIVELGNLYSFTDLEARTGIAWQMLHLGY